MGQSSSRWGTPVWATLTVVVAAGIIVIVETAVAAQANAFNSFLWSGTIGTLILLVVYVLASVGCIMLVFVRHKLPVPMWQIIVPIAGLVVLGYTLYRNVWPWLDRLGRVDPVDIGHLAGRGGDRGDLRGGHGAQARRGAGRPRGHQGAGHRGTRAQAGRGAGRDSLVADLLPYVAEQPLVDHHCHGVLRRDADVATLESMLSEGGGFPWRFGVRLAGRVHVPAALPAGARPCRRTPELDDYVARRAELGSTEVSKRFLVAAGASALCVDTGYVPEPITSPAELGDPGGRDRARGRPAGAGGRGRGRGRGGRGGFADAVRSALATRTAAAVGVKSIAAYRTGLDLGAERAGGFRGRDRSRALAARGRSAGDPRGWRTRRCSGSSSGAAWTCGSRCSSTSATGTATSTCTAVTRCCSPRCCGPSSPPGCR